VIVYSPMRSGLLTGRFSFRRSNELPSNDWRRHNDDFRGSGLFRNLELVEGLTPIARDIGCSLPELAVAWTLAWPGVTGAIVGARHPNQVDGWVGGARVQLDAEALERIAMVIEETGAGRGPSAPPPQVTR
jgi:aryl-alcohol dehydrogenase-like predicted oxidoreductase